MGNTNTPASGGSNTARIRQAIRSAGPSILGILWMVALVGLPMTSFTPFVEWTRALVAPFSALPIFLLLLLWLAPYLLRGGKLPRESLPFFAFILVTVAASAAAYFIEFPDFKDKTIFDQELRSFITLVIGSGFYLMFAAYPQDDQRLRRTLQWITVGGALLMVIGLLQAYYLAHDGYSPWYAQFEDWLSVKGSNFQFRGKRVTGLAYEASWFGHQMVMLYFSLWLSAAFQRISAFSFRIFKFSVEDLLLLPAFYLFFMSDPRIALLSLLLMFTYLFGRIALSIYHRLTRSLTKTQRAAAAAASLVGGLALVAGLFVGAVLVTSKLDWRMEAMVSQPPTWDEIRGLLALDEFAVLEFARRMSFMERVIYWLNGWKVFSYHPWLGVGLGNSGYFALEFMHGKGLGSFEIREYMYRLDFLPNTKSLWIRLLAETGVVGFSVFTAWLAVLWKSARLTQLSKTTSLRLVSLGSRLAALALLAEGFSIDSFAMPYLWIWLGLASVAGMVFRQEIRRAPEGAQVEVVDSPHPQQQG